MGLFIFLRLYQGLFTGLAYHDNQGPFEARITDNRAEGIASLCLPTTPSLGSRRDGTDEDGEYQSDYASFMDGYNTPYSVSFSSVSSHPEETDK